MNRLVALLAAVTSGLVMSPAAVSAECFESDPWPSFKAVAPTATQVVVGEVIAEEDGGAVFELRLLDVLRGTGETGQVIEFDHLSSGLPSRFCGTVARVEVGDVIGVATDGVLDGTSGVNTVAFAKGEPRAMFMPAVERLNREEMAALVPPAVADTSPVPIGPVAAAVGLLLLLVAAVLIGDHLNTRRTLSRS